MRPGVPPRAPGGAIALGATRGNTAGDGARPAGDFRRALTFWGLACGFSWGLWILMIASARGWVPFRFPVNPFGSFGPAAAAIVLTAATGGGIRSLLRPLWAWRLGRWWVLATLGGPMALVAASVGIFVLLGGHLPEPKDLDKAYLAPGLFLFILVMGGPLGEEIGWRGYALPRLLSRFDALHASLVVAVMWFVWHVPLFWLEGAAQRGASIPGFFVMVVAYAILFTWVYVGTRGSLFAVLLLHTSVNFSTFCVGAVFPALENDRRFETIFLALGVACAVAVLAARGRSLNGSHAAATGPIPVPIPSLRE